MVCADDSLTTLRQPQERIARQNELKRQPQAAARQRHRPILPNPFSSEIQASSFFALDPILASEDSKDAAQPAARDQSGEHTAGDHQSPEDSNFETRLRALEETVANASADNASQLGEAFNSRPEHVEHESYAE